nr:T9SS type A sorting domain-containing protein [Bacteroidota bacterium]
FTAGRVPGSFYVIRSTQDPTQTHAWLYIDYSNDYGETFTTYFHDLDSLYTSIPSLEKPDFSLINFPNPFSIKTSIGFQLPKNANNAFLSIYNINGVLINQYAVHKKNTIHWDGTDSKGLGVPNGIYLYNISCNNVPSQFNKLIFINQKQ